jgi:hypothetical protein
MTEEMLDAGASVAWVSEHPVKTPRDMKVVAHIFAHLEVQPRYQDFLAWEAEVGDEGVAVAYTSTAACAMHHILKELMPTEEFFFAQHDEPALIDELAEAVGNWYQQIRRVGAESPAEIVLLGANYDDSITSPPFFRKYILPELRSYGEQLHARGKLLLTHTDGENRRLMPLYLEAGFDIADSVCPAPMTRLSFEDFRQGFADRIAIWGGIPSVLFCEGSASFEQFRTCVDDLLARHAGESRWIVGVSDMVTADAEFDRLCYITEKMCG